MRIFEKIFDVPQPERPHRTIYCPVITAQCDFHYLDGTVAENWKLKYFYFSYSKREKSWIRFSTIIWKFLKLVPRETEQINEMIKFLKKFREISNKIIFLSIIIKLFWELNQIYNLYPFSLSGTNFDCAPPIAKMQDCGGLIMAVKSDIEPEKFKIFLKDRI